MRTTFPFPRRAAVRTTFGIGLGVLTLFGFIPAIGVVALSFTNIRGIPGIPVDWVGLENYRQVFGTAHRSDTLNAVRNTIEYAGVSSIVQIIAALGIAVLLNHRLRGRNFYRSVVFMPTVLGVTVTGLIWTLIFTPNVGPAARIVRAFGSDSAFFGDPAIALRLATGIQVWSMVGVSVVIFLAGLQSIPTELYEVSSIDGASGWQQFRWVTFPLLAPSMTANVLLGIVNAMQSYQLIYVLTGPHNPATQVLSLVVYAQGFGGSHTTMISQTQGYAAAISMVQFALVAVVALGALGYLRRREARL